MHVSAAVPVFLIRSHEHGLQTFLRSGFFLFGDSTFKEGHPDNTHFVAKGMYPFHFLHWLQFSDNQG